MHITIIDSDPAVFARRPDATLMFLSYINCGGDETQLSQCPYLNDTGPTDGIVREGDGKVYCQRRRPDEFLVAKLRCSGKYLSLHVKLCNFRFSFTE